MKNEYTEKEGRFLVGFYSPILMLILGVILGIAACLTVAIGERKADDKIITKQNYIIGEQQETIKRQSEMIQNLYDRIIMMELD